MPNDNNSPLPSVLQQRLQEIAQPIARRRLLIAEDDAVSARIMKAALDQAGYDTVVVGDGAEAWNLFQQEPVRLIISDWTMPGFDGLELCRRVRATTKLPYTYFILFTANGTTPENYTLATAAGVDDFLTKPIDRAILRMRLAVAERILKFTAEIRQLKELIPICSYCRKIRNEEKYWARVEDYIEKETGSRFSHSACPDCYDRELARITKGIPEPS